MLLASLPFIQSSETMNDVAGRDTITQVDLKYLALGDSYTIGEAIDENQRFPVQLSAKLSQDGISCSTRVLATTGWTTNELLVAIDNSEDLLSRYEVVSLLIGVNNQYRGYPINQYQDDFKTLLEKSIQLAGSNPSKVFVLSIPDYSVTPFGQSKNNSASIALEIDRYNQIAKEICAEQNVEFFDITPISRKAENDLNLIASDGLHPSAKMYHQWVEMIYPHVKLILTN